MIYLQSFQLFFENLKITLCEFTYNIILISNGIMSQNNPRQHQDQSLIDIRSPSRTLQEGELMFSQTQPNLSIRERDRPNTQRNQLHYDSPSRYDIDFYQRKVNRLENDIATLQDALSLARFRLHKAEDFEIKYNTIFNQHQKVSSNYEQLFQQNGTLKKTNDDLRDKIAQLNLQIKNRQNRINSQKQLVQQLRKQKQETKNKFSNEGAQEKASVEEAYLRQIDNLKRQTKQKEDKLHSELTSAKTVIIEKENIESTMNYKLQKIKDDKNEEIQRLNNLLRCLKTQLSKNNQQNDEKTLEYRTQLINSTQSRILDVKKLSNTIEETLLSQLRNLNEAIKKKDSQINFLIESDRKYVNETQAHITSLKAHIKRLQDKIFTIQRENEIELFKTIDRLRTQYNENIQNLHNDIQTLKSGHQQKVKSLQGQINNLKSQNKLLDYENKKIEDQHKKLSRSKEEAVSMLSKKLIDMESARDIDLKNYTTSMRNIEEEVKSKLDDLHTSIQSKNTESQILNSQLNLKNEEITYLLNEIDKLRGQNRQKMRKLETTNALEQNSLNDLISSYKKEILQLKRSIHQLENQLSDKDSQAQLKIQLMKQELNNQKEANAKLKTQYEFITERAKQLEVQLKKQRLANVDVLHDHTVSRRETVQIREQVRMEISATKQKELEQFKNVFKLQKQRLQSELASKEHELRDKKAQLGRLLVQYKNLQKKVGKASKLDKGSQENAKCQATLDAEILLTQNIYNAINKP